MSVTVLQQQLEKSFKKQQYAKKVSEKRISKKNYQEDKYVTRSSWLNCALRDDVAVYWFSIGHYEAVANGN